MNEYKVEWTKGSLVYSRIIEATDLQHAKMIVAMDDIFDDGGECVKITEVKKHRVMWIEHHSWEGYATDEDDAKWKANEYADTHDTFDESVDFDVEEIEPDRPEIEVSFTLLHKYKRSVGTSGNYVVLLS